VPLTPNDVHDVRFDHAPLGKRGYHEDQVDSFLDRVELALQGEVVLTVQEVKEVEFDQGGLVRRGYDEKQVDDFLEAVVIQLEGGDPKYVVNRVNGHASGVVNGGLVNGEGAMAANGSGSIIGTLHEAISESVNGHSTGHLALPAEPLTEAVPAPRPEVRPKPQPEPDPNSVPLPPAVPGMHGYRQRDVQRMAACVRAAVRSPHGPTSEDIARMRLERVEDGEKGYDPFLVEALRDAWVAELRRQGR